MEKPPENEDFLARMAGVITQRYRANAGKSLRDVYQLDADFLDTESDEEFAIRNRSRILGVLSAPRSFEALLEVFVGETIAFTYASNQFIQIAPREEAEIRRIYTSYLQEMRAMLVSAETDAQVATGLRELVAGHFRDLRANITRFFDREASADAQSNVILQKAVCADYPAELQLKILGAQPAGLVQPVLDLGCGKSGLLVRYLNALGIQAVGVDRVVEQSPHLIQADWLDYPLESERWGTVVSHMAFSNHFMFHHLYRHGSIEPYARRYMAILHALSPGGSFYYTPGLPFIEAYLPQEKYTLTRQPVIENDRLYACRVLRIR